MPERNPAEPPSRWTVINDYSKTVITVCAALLAFIGAFASKLPDEQLSMSAIVIGCVIVGLLCVAALCSLAVPGMLDRYLRVMAKGKPVAAPPENGWRRDVAEDEAGQWPKEKNQDTATEKEWNARASMIWKTKAAANLSYLALALAVIGMAVFAIYQSMQPKKNGQSDQTHAGPTLPAPHYEMVYSAIHHTKHGQQAHTFLLDRSTGDLWQMVCSPDGLVSFRRIRRLDVNGKVEVQAPVAVPATVQTTGP